MRFINFLKVQFIAFFLSLFSWKAYFVCVKFNNTKSQAISVLMFLACLVAIPATYKVNITLNILEKAEIVQATAKIPASVLNINGILTPVDKSETFKVIVNSNDTPIVIYNVADIPLDASLNNALLEIRSDSVVINTTNGKQRLPWNSIISGEFNFSPLEASSILDDVINTPIITYFCMAFAWFFIMFLFNAILCTIILITLAKLLYKVIYSNSIAFCLIAQATSVVTVISILQLFISLPIPWLVLGLMPLLYIISFTYVLKKSMNIADDKGYVFIKSVSKEELQYMQQQARKEAFSKDANINSSATSSDNKNNNNDKGGFFTP